ncbi:helix-turn-helix domain-containing protein [Sphingomonas sp.]|uniref:helix-turn-helix domain-containing protein n=1 Tax=Sphingomonas sp. TaxID=28214 RepID=UPI003B3AF5E5
MNGEDDFPANGPLRPVGEQLRSAREAQGLTIEEMAAATSIPLRHLRTIEAGEYEGLPAATYSVGFIKTLARRLNLDGTQLAAQFRSEIGRTKTEHTQTLPYEPADPRRTPPVGLAILGLVAAIVLALGYLYWRGSAEQPAQIAAATSDLSSPSAPAAAQPSPSAAAPAPVAAAPTADGPVVIGATQDVWVKVADGGKTLFLGMLHPGDRFQVPADAVAPLLTTGRPGATSILVGQTTIPPVGDPDRMAKNVSLKASDLLARMAPAGAAPPPAGNAPAPVENAAGPV